MRRLRATLLPLLALLCCVAASQSSRQALAGRELLQQEGADESSSAGTWVVPSFTWNWRTGLYLCVTFVVSALSMPAGFGGGIIFVPLADALLQFSARAASAQSQPLILGGALGSAWVTLARRHPLDSSKPLVDFHVLLLMLPTMMCGVAAGVLLNNTFPNYLITILLMCWLLWQCVMSFSKTYVLYRAHQEQQRAKAQQAQQQAQQAQQAQQLEPPQQQQQAAGAAPAAWHSIEVKPWVPEGPHPGSPRSHVERRPSFVERLSRLSYPEVPSLATGWMTEGSWAGRRPTRPPQLQRHSMPIIRRRTSAEHDRAAAEAQRRRSMPGRILEAEVSEAGHAAAEFARKARKWPAMPTISSVGQGLEELGQAGEPGDSEAAAAAATGTAQEPGSGPANGGSSSPGAFGLRRPESLFDLASEAMKQAVDEVLRLPRFDRPSLRSLAGIGWIWGGFLGFQVARAATSKSKGTSCFAGYYAMLAAEFSLLLAAAVSMTWRIAVRRRAAKEAQRERAKAAAAAAAAEAGGGSEGGFEGVDGAPEGEGEEEEEEEEEQGEQATWSLKKLVVVQCIVAVGGTVATLLGLGGGLIVGPLLLYLDVHPLVASATSSLMVLLSVSSATITYAIQGQLTLSYSLIYGASCFVGALVGVIIVNNLVRKSGATWLVVMCLAVVVAAGTVIDAAVLMPTAVSDLSSGTDVEFTGLCKH